MGESGILGAVSLVGGGMGCTKRVLRLGNSEISDRRVLSSYLDRLVVGLVLAVLAASETCCASQLLPLRKIKASCSACA